MSVSPVALFFFILLVLCVACSLALVRFFNRLLFLASHAISSPCATLPGSVYTWQGEDHDSSSEALAPDVPRQEGAPFFPTQREKRLTAAIENAPSSGSDEASSIPEFPVSESECRHALGTIYNLIRKPNAAAEDILREVRDVVTRLEGGMIHEDLRGKVPDPRSNKRRYTTAWPAHC